MLCVTAEASGALLLGARAWSSLGVEKAGVTEEVSGSAGLGRTAQHARALRESAARARGGLGSWQEPGPTVLS